MLVFWISTDPLNMISEPSIEIEQLELKTEDNAGKFQLVPTLTSVAASYIYPLEGLTITSADGATTTPKYGGFKLRVSGTADFEDSVDDLTNVNTYFYLPSTDAYKDFLSEEISPVNNSRQAAEIGQFELESEQSLSLNETYSVRFNKTKSYICSPY
jgi:hypothetical protein